ncbi:MAG: aldo/keto reductase [Bacteroidia bacterium]|nr:aldo/keto reductase [Bacteroidia bacterium]
MEYRRLGKSGLQVSALSFGSWVTFGSQVGDDVAENCMKLAYDNGVNFFDNAEAYASGNAEIVMGKILKKMGWNRSTFVVSSKVYWGGKLPNQIGLSKKHVVECCNNALIRMQVDYLDLFFCHRPDKNTPMEETVRAMNNLITQGKILYWGTSEWSAQEIMEAYSVARQFNLVPPTMEQPQYNLFFRDRVEVEYHKLYSEIGLGTTVWSPLASGLLTGKYIDVLPTDTRIDRPGMEWLKNLIAGEENKWKHEKVKRLKNISNDLGVSLADFCIAWTLKNPHVSTAILGASKLEQLKETIKSLDVLPLMTTEIMERVEGIMENKPKMPAY